MSRPIRDQPVKQDFWTFSRESDGACFGHHNIQLSAQSTAAWRSMKLTHKEWTVYFPQESRLLYERSARLHSGRQAMNLVQRMEHAKRLFEQQDVEGAFKAYSQIKKRLQTTLLLTESWPDVRFTLKITRPLRKRCMSRCAAFRMMQAHGSYMVTIRRRPAGARMHFQPIIKQWSLVETPHESRSKLQIS